jgi:2-oxoisovalerate dehydrogenase E1 component alpha subunit
VGDLGAERQADSRIPLYQRASGFGFPGIRVDGNDVLAVYAVTKTALDNARSGQGPTFVEAFTYRMGAHTTSTTRRSTASRPRSRCGSSSDPIARFKAWLTREGIVDRPFFDRLEAEGDELAASIRSRCLEMPDPEPLAMFDHVYVDDHPVIEAEREMLRTYLESFEGAH